MRVSVSEAKGQLTELVRRAEAGDDVVLTRHGQAAVRLVPVTTALEPAARRKLLEALRRTASVKASPGPDAARSQDELYGDDGLPEVMGQPLGVLLTIEQLAIPKDSWNRSWTLSSISAASNCTRRQPAISLEHACTN